MIVIVKLVFACGVLNRYRVNCYVKGLNPRKMKHFIVFCFVLLSLSDDLGAYGPIKLFPFERSETSSCREGIAAEKDTITVNGEADFNDPAADLTNIIIIESIYLNASSLQTSPLQMCAILANTTRGNTSFCFFEALDKDKTFRFNITQPAKLGLVEIIAYLLFKNSSRLTTELKLPGIFAPSSAAIKVEINGQIAKDGNSIEIDRSYLKIDAHCKSNLKPCHLLLKFNDTNNVTQAEDFLSFQKPYTEPKVLLVTLVTTVCKPDIYQEVFTYKVSLDFETQSSASTLYIIVGVVLGTGLLVIVFLFILYKRGWLKLQCNQCKRSHSPNKTDAETSEIHKLNRRHNEDDVEVPKKDTEYIPKGLVGDRRQIFQNKQKKDDDSDKFNHTIKLTSKDAKGSDAKNNSKEKNKAKKEKQKGDDDLDSVDDSVSKTSNKASENYEKSSETANKSKKKNKQGKEEWTNGDDVVDDIVKSAIGEVGDLETANKSTKKDTEDIPKGIVRTRGQLYRSRLQDSKVSVPLLVESTEKTWDDMPSLNGKPSKCHKSRNEENVRPSKGYLLPNQTSMNKSFLSNGTSTLEIVPVRKTSTNPSLQISPEQMEILQLEDSEKSDPESGHIYDTIDSEVSLNDDKNEHSSPNSFNGSSGSNRVERNGTPNSRALENSSENRTVSESSSSVPV